MNSALLRRLESELVTPWLQGHVRHGFIRCMNLLPLSLCACVLALTGIVSAKDTAATDVLPATVKPWDRHYVDFEVGYLWKVGGSTELRTQAGAGGLGIHCLRTDNEKKSNPGKR